MRNLAILKSIALVSAFLLTSCNQKETKIIREAAPQGEASQPQGTSSGGGSFGDESSNYILNVAKEQLVASLRDIGRPITANYPDGWSQERLRQVIANVRTSKDKKVSRHGTDLMFNYGLDADSSEPYIEAVELFYSTYASVAINSMESHQFLVVVREIKLKLLHEAAHLMGIGVSKETDSKARDFARAILTNHGKLVMPCYNKEELPTEAKKWLRSSFDLGASLSCIDFRIAQLGEYPNYYGDFFATEMENNESRKEGVHGRSDMFMLLFDPSTGHSYIPSVSGYDQSDVAIGGSSDHLPLRAEVLLQPSEGRDIHEVSVSSSVRNYLDAEEPYFLERYGIEKDRLTKLGNLVLADLEWLDRDRWNSVFPGWTKGKFDFEALEDETGVNKYQILIREEEVLKKEAVVLNYEQKPTDMAYFDSILATGQVRVDIHELSESVTYDPYGGYLDMDIKQTASIQCGDSPAEPVNTELSIRLTCDQEPITPVKVRSFID